MRLFGKKFIPGVRVEIDADQVESKKPKDLDIVSNHSEQSTATTYEPNSEETTNNECDDYDEDNYETALESFEAFTSKYFISLLPKRFSSPTLDGVLCNTISILNLSEIPCDKIQV